jgi:uncharacterized protein (TIGR02646 family)
MIKREKDFSAIPESLVPPYLDLFPNRETIPTLSKTTHEKRMRIIKAGRYIDESEFNERYKKDDIRIGLINIYKSKCAFCEMQVEQYHIEHYRPKKIYYWLSFSWDNLLMVCPTCNQNKGTNFEVIGQQVQFTNSEDNIKTINNLSAGYNAIEQPKMINPEFTDPLGKIGFQKNGVIDSTDINFAYTIRICSIDRDWLNDERRKLLDIFKRDITSVFYENRDITGQRFAISTIVKKFIRDAQDDNLPFLAFRRFSISSGWLNEIIKEFI